MPIKDIADKMHGVKRIEGEYTTKKEYRKHRKIEILDNWTDKLESAYEKECRYNSYAYDKIENITKEFFEKIKDYIEKYKNIDLHNDDFWNIVNIGHDIIYDYITKRCRIMIDYNLIPLPILEGEKELNMWFTDNHGSPFENYVFKALGFEVLHRHVKGIDYQCKYRYENCCMMDMPGPYIPISKMIDKNIYDIFIELIDNKSFLIELEDLSGNFLLHKHGHADMIICYKKDKDIDNIRILELRPKG